MSLQRNLTIISLVAVIAVLGVVAGLSFAGAGDGGEAPGDINTTGDECDRPGSGVLHLMLLPVSTFQVVGGWCPSATPVPRGPRNEGQFRGEAESADVTPVTETAKRKQITRGTICHASRHHDTSASRHIV